MATQKIKVIGLMSGTSLDGLDVCLCDFEFSNPGWKFEILHAKTYSYTDELKKHLAEAQNYDALSFITLHSQYGFEMGKLVNQFIEEFGIKPDIIASHGHSIYHVPQKHIMYQIGDGAAIAAETKIPVVSDFRRLDIMLGGQGAPLVPIGDRTLFAEYDYCLNIGGFSNVSFERDGQRIAYDVSPSNYISNYYCRQIGLEYDEDGKLGRKGTICQPLLDELNGLAFYHHDGPKSLAREWVEEDVFPLFDKYGLSLEDKLRTLYEHVAYQISRVGKGGKMLITGGGAFNKYLVELITEKGGFEVVIPDPIIIAFKEALVFALLGAMYMFDQNSCLTSVTGASRDNIGGMLFKM